MDPKDTRETGIPRPRFKTIEQVEDDFEQEIAHLYMVLEKATSGLKAHDDFILKMSKDFEANKKSYGGLESRMDKFINTTGKKFESFTTQSVESVSKIQEIQKKIAQLFKEKAETENLMKNYYKQFSDVLQRISKVEASSGESEQKIKALDKEKSSFIKDQNSNIVQLSNKIDNLRTEMTTNMENLRTEMTNHVENLRKETASLRIETVSLRAEILNLRTETADDFKRLNKKFDSTFDQIVYIIQETTRK